MMHKNRSVDVHQFSMVPKAEIPRSQFRMQKAVKTTFNSGFLIPILCEEILPGDSFRMDMTAFCRLSTPIKPFMDNLYLESFFFFVPNRLVWTHWQNFCGEQVNPGDSTSFVIPQIVSPVGGFAQQSIYDQFGLPCVGQTGAGNTISVNALPFRGYNLIYNQWFRDQNLINSVTVFTSDGPDLSSGYFLLKRGKRHDYFTSCLPFLQKGTAPVLPLGTSAPVKTTAGDTVTGTQNPLRVLLNTGAAPVGGKAIGTVVGGGVAETTTAITTSAAIYPSNLYADLSVASTITVNALRLSVQTQKLLERDARGGTRYTEVVLAHFGVRSPDARLQRPEYLGGGRTPVNVVPVPQTSNTPVSGTPQGNLSAFATALTSGHSWSQSFTEHGYVIGLINVYADLTYQQGIRRHWSRSTRYDYYWPAFANLGEQAVLNKEIFSDGSAADNNVFGYAERWAEYRYNPSEIRSLMRSTSATPLDVWHLSQKFLALPTLGQVFIEESPPISRVIAVPSEPEFLGDFFFDIVAARPLPLYSVPGLMDHF